MTKHLDLEQELQKTQKELKEVRQEYEQYAYIVSHDFSAPFRHIEGFAQILLNKEQDHLDEKSLSYLKTIIQAGQKGQSLLEALLAYSRLNTTACPFQPINLERTFQEIQKDLADLIDQKQATLQYEPLPIIQGDPQQIKLLFFHLLKNALIYCKIAPIISIQVQESDHDFEFYIQDNGIGIPKEFMPEMYTPLTRGVTDPPGSGMGLALVHKIINRHQGDISCIPSEGGTLFALKLPKRDA